MTAQNISISSLNESPVAPPSSALRAQISHLIPWLTLKAKGLCRTRHQDADDLVQTTVIRALEKEHLYNPAYGLKGWLSRVMYTQFVSEFCRKQKDRFHAAIEEDTLYAPIDTDQPALMGDIFKALESLSEKDRDLIHMICLNGTSYTDASEKLGIPVGTIRSRLFRARTKLANRLDASSLLKSEA